MQLTQALCSAFVFQEWTLRWWSFSEVSPDLEKCEFRQTSRLHVIRARNKLKTWKKSINRYSWTERTSYFRWQNKRRRSFRIEPCNGNPLLLSSRKRLTVLATQSIVAFGELWNHVMYGGKLQRKNTTQIVITVEEGFNIVTHCSKLHTLSTQASLVIVYTTHWLSDDVIIYFCPAILTKGMILDPAILQ